MHEQSGEELPQMNDHEGDMCIIRTQYRGSNTSHSNEEFLEVIERKIAG